MFYLIVLEPARKITDWWGCCDEFGRLLFSG